MIATQLVRNFLFCSIPSVPFPSVVYQMYYKTDKKLTWLGVVPYDCNLTNEIKFSIIT